MGTSRPRASHLLFGALLVCAPSLAAQGPEGSRTLSAGAVAESLAVLDELNQALRANRNDAAALHRRGLIAWALSIRARTEPRIRGLDWTSLGRMADTSLRLAALIEPHSPEYLLQAGRYLLASGVSLARATSYGMFEAALEVARNSEPSIHAELAVETGRVYWRRYDALADSWMTIGSGRPCLPTQPVVGTYFLPTKADTAERLAWGSRIIKSELAPYAMPRPFEVAGERDYLQAEAFFREAFAALPTAELPFRQLAMLLVERRRWGELAETSVEKLRHTPDDAWGWLSFGLAKLRLKEPAIARLAFDRGLAALPDDERRRLDQLERVLPLRFRFPAGSDSVAIRAALERLYWLSADPLWADDFAEPRLEFLARVVHSELRWTVGEMGVRGADTDRGELYVRLGPPDLIVALRPPPDMCTMWVYDAGMLFTLTGQPTFGTSRHTADEMTAALLETSPARWDNVALPTIDSIPTRIARFRAEPDSVDIVVAAVPPVERIQAAADVRGAVRTDFWVMRGGLQEVARAIERNATGAPQLYTHRVARGNYTFRIEATADGSMRAGRAGAVVVAGPDTTTGFTTVGFGLSDILLARTIERGPGAPRRWRDLVTQPLVGAAAAASDLAIVWENYELGSRDGTAEYEVTVVIERERSATGRIAARISTAVTDRIGVDQANDRVSMSFSRLTAHADALVDHVNLSLGATPAGSYLLSVRVADKVTGRVTMRSTRFTIQ